MGGETKRMSRREADARWLLREAAARMEHAPHPGPAERSCFRCQIERFLKSRRPLPRENSGGDRG
jgi:hypothetical protein